MSDDEKTTISVNIGDRSYPLRVAKDKHQSLLAAAQQINEKIAQYQGRYSDKDMQDFLAMSALQFASKLAETPSTNNQSAEALSELDNLLGNYIKSIQRS